MRCCMFHDIFRKCSILNEAMLSRIEPMSVEDGGAGAGRCRGRGCRGALSTAAVERSLGRVVALLPDLVLVVCPADEVLQLFGR